VLHPGFKRSALSVHPVFVRKPIRNKEQKYVVSVQNQPALPRVNLDRLRNKRVRRVLIVCRASKQY